MIMSTTLGVIEDKKEEVRKQKKKRESFFHVILLVLTYLVVVYPFYGIRIITSESEWAKNGDFVVISKQQDASVHEYVFDCNGEIGLIVGNVNDVVEFYDGKVIRNGTVLYDVSVNNKTPYYKKQGDTLCVYKDHELSSLQQTDVCGKVLCIIRRKGL